LFTKETIILDLNTVLVSANSTRT